MTYRYRRYYYRRRLTGGQLAVIAAAVVVLGSAAGASHHASTAGTPSAGAAVAADGSAAPAGSASWASWARAFLQREDLPQTPCEMATVEAWEGAEGSPASWRNPLDTTLPEPGSVSENSDGVQAYASRAQGLAATDATLRNGLYGPVLTALGDGGGQAAADAVAASSWGTGPFTVGC